MYAIAINKRKKESPVDRACVKELVYIALHIPLMISKISDFSRNSLFVPVLSLLDILAQTYYSVEERSFVSSLKDITYI